MSEAASRLARGAAVALAAAAFVPAWSDEPGERAPFAPVEARALAAPGFRPRAELQQWSIGEPTAEEQQLLELMNRARTDPRGEGDRIFVDYGSKRVRTAVNYFLEQRPAVEFTRAENRNAFHGYAARPPLAFNARLIDAARGHSQVLRQFDTQSHQVTGAGEPDFSERLANAGYSGDSAAESVFSYADHMLHAHAGFAIDYGQPVLPGQSRPYLGHRLNLMAFDGDPYRDYLEVGIGVVEDASAATEVGPRIVTIDFARPSAGPQVFVTGVCCDDRDGDGLYDPGEGLAGVRIEVDSGSYFAISSASGGYAVPVTAGSGGVRVTATGQPGTPGEVVGAQTVAVQVNQSSVKADFGRPVDPPLPAFQAYDLDVPFAFADGVVPMPAIVVPAPLAGVPAEIGDVTALVEVDHPERAEFTATLVSPAGTEVVLFDHGAPGAALRGEFGRGLDAAGDLGAFVGEDYAGPWCLRIEDTVPGNSGSLVRWSLRVRPAWLRPVHARRTNLDVKRLSLKDSPLPAGNSIRFVADALSLGPSDPGAPCDLRLRAADGSRAVLVHAVVPNAAITWFRSGTSRTVVSAKLTGLDLPAAPLPAVVVVELALGETIVSQTVPLAAGSYAGTRTQPVSHEFVIEALESLRGAAGTTTTLRGRLHAPGTLLGSGVLDVFAGGFHHRATMSEMTERGTKRVYRSAFGLTKLVVDPVTGVFKMTFATKGPLYNGGGLEIALRLGDDGFLGAATIVPEENGPSLSY